MFWMFSRFLSDFFFRAVGTSEKFHRLAGNHAARNWLPYHTTWRLSAQSWFFLPFVIVFHQTRHATESLKLQADFRSFSDPISWVTVLSPFASITFRVCGSRGRFLLMALMADDHYESGRKKDSCRDLFVYAFLLGRICWWPVVLFHNIPWERQYILSFACLYRLTSTSTLFN